MSKNNTIKVTFQGETKRVQAPESYEQLVAATLEMFPEANLGEEVVRSYKFYFLDEDQELISISSQDDFEDNSEYIQASSGVIMGDAPASSIIPKVSVPTLIYSNSAAAVKDQLRKLMQSRQQVFDGSVFDGSSMASGSSRLEMKDRMAQALQNTLLRGFEESKKGNSEEKQPIGQNMQELIEKAVKKEVESYCAANLPRMIQDELAKWAPQKLDQQNMVDKVAAAQAVVVPAEEVKESNSPESGLMKLAKSEEDKQVAQPLDQQAEEDFQDCQQLPSASFVRENDLSSEDSKIEAGKKFKRSYTLQNDGEIAWPDTTVFSQRLEDGVDLKMEPCPQACVLPGQEVTVEVTCNAPYKEGIFCAKFGLESDNNLRFGETVQCTIQVPKLEEHKQVEEALLLVNRDKSLNGDDSINGGIFRPKSPSAAQSSQQVVSQQMSQLNPYITMVPQKQDMKLQTPKQIYTARQQTEAIQDQVICDGMDRLFDMGFTNYDANLSLLRKYKDFGMAAEHLCVHGDTGIVLNASNANK